MHPGHGPRGGLDPRLYQYGGLWLYPIGILLKVLPVTVRSDVAWYLDHPEAFGRFYVIARCYSAAWGLLGVAVVFQLVRRICGGWAFPFAAGMLFAMLPVVVNQSHEGKPHLAGAVLMLCAALAGSVYVETGKRAAAVSAGALCGAATGMILSTYPIFIILPVMSVLRRQSARNGVREIPDQNPTVSARLQSQSGSFHHQPPAENSRTPLWGIAVPLAVALCVYIATNPYVAINLICNREVLRSNLGTSAAMYHTGLSLSSLRNAALLIANGAGALTALGGAIGMALLAPRRRRCGQDPT